jgi:hypothetical protein
MLQAEASDTEVTPCGLHLVQHRSCFSAREPRTHLDIDAAREAPHSATAKKQAMWLDSGGIGPIPTSA